MSELTPFQRNALDKIRHLGGTIIYDEETKQWLSRVTRVRAYVPSADFKTEGFIGWPTIRALVEAKRLVPHGNEYKLASEARDGN